MLLLLSKDNNNLGGSSKALTTLLLLLTTSSFSFGSDSLWQSLGLPGASSHLNGIDIAAVRGGGVGASDEKHGRVVVVGRESLCGVL
jgi:hypothetical protein